MPMPDIFPIGALELGLELCAYTLAAALMATTLSPTKNLFFNDFMIFLGYG